MNVTAAATVQHTGGHSLAPRSDFPLLASMRSLHYLDSAATSQKPSVVLDAVRRFYETSNANPHRGAYALSVAATEAYHDARRAVARFLGAGDEDCLVFTRGTTEAINLVMNTWGRANVRPGDEIVVTSLEHHGNFVPWQQLAIEKGATLRIVEATADQEIDPEDVRKVLSSRTKIVAITHVSNAVGSITPLSEIIPIVRDFSPAVIVVDGAQGAAHLPVAFDESGADFYAFSGHKMLGPMGSGGLIGRRALLEAMPPWHFGGDMIEWVHDDRATWNVLPHKFEAGTPNAADAVGLAAAVQYLGAFGMNRLRAHEQELISMADAALRSIDGVHVYGPPSGSRSAVVSFTVDGVHPHDLATILDQHNVCIRAGHHCAQPLMRRLGVSATARASFHVYSDVSDVTALADAVRGAVALFGSD